MTDTSPLTDTPTRSRPERATQRRNIGSTLRHRPEWGAVAGTILVFGIFAVIARNRGFLTGLGTVNYLQVAAELGILVVPVCLLMIAGEFDLSIGSTAAASGVVVAYLVVDNHWSLIAALCAAFGLATVIGLFNGLVVVRTGVPSFIVTLASQFVVRGVTVAYTGVLTSSTLVEGLPQNGGDNIVGHALAGRVGLVPASVFWWVGLTMLATWILAKTAFGNWIYGAGGDPAAARNVGVPVARVKVTLFVATSLAAAMLGAIMALETGSGDVGRATGYEFNAIAATVIGGTLLTGGYGSAIGAALGTLIFGIVSQGIFFTGIDSNWFQAILGTMLLGAVLINHYVRLRLLRPRRAHQ
jgi:simple sugar transport system permease protein